GKRQARASTARPAAAPDSQLRLKLVDANPAPQAEALDALPGVANYYLGNDPAQWRTNLPTYSKVRYADVYPGIDLVYYGHHGQLRYDLVVAPGADPSAIALAVDGADGLEVDAAGDLVLRVGGGELRQHQPRVYQDGDDGRHEIAGHYVLKD